MNYEKLNKELDLFVQAHGGQQLNSEMAKDFSEMLGKYSIDEKTYLISLMFFSLVNLIGAKDAPQA